MALPFPGQDYTPFDILTAEELDQMVANIEALAAGTGLDDDAITTPKIDDGAVTPDKLLAGTGTSWPWVSWTPTFTSITGGTINYAKYKQVGKTVFYRLKYTLAGAGVSGNPQFTLPVSCHADYTASSNPAGSVAFTDSGNNSYMGKIIVMNSTTFVCVGITTNGSILNITNTVPFTWGTGDIFEVSGFYEAA